MDTATAATLISLSGTGWAATAHWAYRQHHRARTDTLTGLANRDVLIDLIRRAARHRHGTAALVMLDVDRFKTINDTHGHHTGNLVLQHLATRLGSLAQSGERAIRLHGDEFALWLGVHAATTATRHAAQRAEAISAVLADPIPIGDTRLVVTVSAGSAALRVAGLTSAALLAFADHALYQAKRDTHRALGAHLPTPAATAATRLRDTRKRIA